MKVKVRDYSSPALIALIDKIDEQMPGVVEVDDVVYLASALRHYVKNYSTLYEEWSELTELLQNIESHIGQMSNAINNSSL